MYILRRLDYLQSHGLHRAAEALMQETGLSALSVESEGLLERKWTAVLKLQDKVCVPDSLFCKGLGTHSDVLTYKCGDRSVDWRALAASK
jgi:hypothetical protein